jgi:hypothetical protein
MTAAAHATSPSQPDPGAPSPFVGAIAVRLADEGIPVLAIARATSTPSEVIYEALRDAIARGSIVEMPRDDWPAGSNRSSRSILIGTPLDDETKLKCACARYFSASPLEAAMLALMLKRSEVTKEQLHGVIENERGPNKEMTEIKMVDVMICKLRKKIKDHNILIKTMWGVGYYIPSSNRESAFALLLAMAEA